MRPMLPDLAQNTYGKSDENLPPEPAALLFLAKPLDEIARQGLVVAWTYVPQKPNGSPWRIAFPVIHVPLPSGRSMPLHKLISAVRVILKARRPTGVARK